MLTAWYTTKESEKKRKETAPNAMNAVMTDPLS
jgi:hypothetical protein